MPHSGEKWGLDETGQSWGTFALLDMQSTGTERTDKWYTHSQAGMWQGRCNSVLESRGKHR